VAKRKTHKDEPLNLVPIMNLVVCLIPMVLVGTSLVKIGVIDVNAPNFGMGKSTADEDEKKPLNLSIGLGRDAIYLKAGGVPLGQLITDGESSEDGGIKIPNRKKMEMVDVKVGETETVRKPFYYYDYPTLYTRLVQIKDRIKNDYPNENSIKVSADPNIPVKHVIEVMDLMRYRLCLRKSESSNCEQQDSFTNDQDLRKAEVHRESKGENREGNVDLWPVVIFAKAE